MHNLIDYDVPINLLNIVVIIWNIMLSQFNSKYPCNIDYIIEMYAGHCSDEYTKEIG